MYHLKKYLMGLLIAFGLLAVLTPAAEARDHHYRHDDHGHDYYRHGSSSRSYSRSAYYGGGYYPRSYYYGRPYYRHVSYRPYYYHRPVYYDRPVYYGYGGPRVVVSFGSRGYYR